MVSIVISATYNMIQEGLNLLLYPQSYVISSDLINIQYVFYTSYYDYNLYDLNVLFDYKLI